MSRGSSSATGLLLLFLTAASATARAADAFPEVPLGTPRRMGHAAAYASLASGAALIGVSFAFSEQANRRYDDYLTSTEPRTIDRLYDETVRYDRLSSGSLIAGEVLIATGLYLRFLRQPPDGRVAVLVEPGRCAVALRF